MINLEKQYKYLVDQLEKEVQELYWLYNLFFVGNGLLVGYAVANRTDSTKGPIISGVIGIVLSAFWFTVFNKQRKWRDGWIKQIIKVENILLVPQEFRFFKDLHYSSYKLWLDSLLFWRKGGIAKVLVFLPASFLIFWIHFIFSAVGLQIRFF